VRRAQEEAEWLEVRRAHAAMLEEVASAQAADAGAAASAQDVDAGGAAAQAGGVRHAFGRR